MPAAACCGLGVQGLGFRALFQRWDRVEWGLYVGLYAGERPQDAPSKKNEGNETLQKMEALWTSRVSLCRVPAYYEPCSERLRVCQLNKSRQL